MRLLKLIYTPLITAMAASAAPIEYIGGIPNHFGLFMYSYDGTIVNETLYARSVPCIKDTTAGISTVQDDPKYGTYGSYTWGIGPHGYLFSYKDGRIATCSPSCIGGHAVFGGTSKVVVETWKTYYNQTEVDPIPTCSVSRSHCSDLFILECESEGQPLVWSYCGSQENESGEQYTLDVLSWSTIIAPGCLEVAVIVEDVPRFWGNQTFERTGIYQNCSAFEDL